MIQAVIQSAAALLVTLSVLPFLRRQSAATRHAILTVGLVCALAVPAVSPLLPSWRAAGKNGDSEQFLGVQKLLTVPVF